MPVETIESDLPCELSQLASEAAVAARICREPIIARELLLWLYSPAKAAALDVQQTEAALVESFNEIIAPMLESASGLERKQTRNAAEYLAAIYSAITEGCSSRGIDIGPRMLAAALLPLYRSLATGDLRSGLEQTRHRLFETTTVLALCQELGADLVDLLELAEHTDASPYATVTEQLQLDIVLVGRLVRRHISSFDVVGSEFDSLSTDQLKSIDDRDVDRAGKAIPDWSQPELLWRLSGELLTHKSDLVLPREWVDTPVPWQSITDHWSSLSRKLANKTAPSQVEDLHASEAAVTGTLQNANATADGLNRNSAPREAADVPAASLIPKVLIAEILSHNDPAFVNIVQRQLSLCRAEAGAMSLASITVVPEDEANRAEICGKGSSGVRPWQQQLVNLLAEHSDVVDPYAFITSDSELLLCLRDIERGETTTILREELESILSGGNVADGTLSTVSSPARYYTGIASTNGPNAGLTPEQMIEATSRCLDAASRQHKSSIKSIDVY